MYEPLSPIAYLRHLALGTALLVSGCASSDDVSVSSTADSASDDTAIATLPPLANAGPDREVLRGYQAQLDATGTWSLDSADITVAWQQVDGEAVYLSNASSPQPYFVAPLREQTLTFELTVSNDAFTVTDDVAVVVKNDPQRVAPVVNGGPDQVGTDLDTSAFVPTTTNDVAESNTAITWEEVTPDRTGLSPRKADDAYSGPKIYKLVGVADGLASAPDYVLVYAYTSTITAPTSSVSGPTQASTGSAVTLAATGSTTNDGSVSYHWEQTRGAPVLTTLDDKHSSIAVDVPRVAQQLVFRVHAYDGKLASAPSEIALEVLPSDGLHPGQLVPGSDVYARSNSQVALMASADNATPGAVLTWQQTRGTTVATNVEEGGNRITFSTPASADELAFVVTSTIDDSESAPAAYRIVVTDEGNDAPQITICLPTMIAADSVIEVSTRITDANGDTVSIVSADTDPEASLTEVEGGTLIGDCAFVPSGAVGASLARVYSLTVPKLGELQLTIAAKDALGASADQQITILP